MKMVDLKTEDMLVKVYFLGVKIFEHECGDDIELQKIKNMWKKVTSGKEC